MPVSPSQALSHTGQTSAREKKAFAQDSQKRCEHRVRKDCCPEPLATFQHALQRSSLARISDVEVDIRVLREVWSEKREMPL